MMDFSEALKHVKNGEKIQRKGWNGSGQWVMLQVPDANSKMQLPYLYMKNVQDKLVPWLASQGDLLAEDWVLA